MALRRFAPPGGLKDFDGVPHQLEAWDEFINATFESEIARVEATVPPGHSQFFNPRTSDAPGQIASQISWIGFPKLLADKYPQDRDRAFQAAEQLSTRAELGITFRPQDEYLEWHSIRDAAGKLTSITFTCEGPEYWEALAQGYPSGYEGPRTAGARGDRDLLLSLYRRYVSPEVELADLFSANRYDRWNVWNVSKGAMHLSHPANTLSAEIDIAAQATILRKRGEQVLTDDDDLIKCGGYGDPRRASDPHIGGVVNALAREGYAISIEDPVGLYMDLSEFPTVGWTKPDGTPVANYWTIERGRRDRALRATYQVPSGAGFVVGDIRIGGEPLRYGGQVAEQVTMALTGVAFGKALKKNDAARCVAAFGGFAAGQPIDPIKIKSRVGF